MRTQPMRYVARVVALITIAAMTVVPARADHRSTRDGVPANYFVKAGGHKPGDPLAPYTYTKFYPQRLQIHAGMTVAWEFEDSFAGLHTVTFGDVDEVPFMRRDEVPGTYALHERSWIFGNENKQYYTRPDAVPCGRAGPVPAEGRGPQPPCLLQPGGTVTSGISDNFFVGYMGERSGRGVPYSPFAITFSTKFSPGVYSYYCRWHADMNGEIEVVDDDVALPTQRTIDRQVAAEIATDTAEADATFAELQEPRQPTLDDEGHRVWTVDVGGATPDGDVNFLAYFPSSLTGARPGDRVLFRARGDEGANTVSFPAELQGGFNADGRCYTARCTGYFAPHGGTVLTVGWGCDVDDPVTGLPATIRYQVIIGCPVGAAEWQLHPLLSDEQRAPRDSVITPGTWHNSGWMVAPHLPSVARARLDAEWPTTFEASLPAAGTFTYACLIHPQAMEGSITVA